MERRSQQTNFQAHQRQARKNSNRLTLAFTFSLVLSALAYFLVTWVFVRHTGLGTWLSVVIAPEVAASDGGKPHTDVQTGAIIASAIIALIVVGIILWGFFQKRNDLHDAGAVAIAQSLGGEFLPAQRNLRQQQYANVVEEMAIAAGVDCPDILYLPNNDSINGFVTGGSNDQVAIAVSQGALDYLTREELQALVAHEFGHIFNRDVFLNNRLSAILHGFFFVKELMTDDDDYYESDSDYDYYDDEDDSNAFFSSSRLFHGGWHIGGRFGVWSWGIIAISWGMIFFGKLIQAAFSRQREWLADAHAVQYTRNKDALVGVFSKAMALQHMQVMTPEVADENAHFLFINYQNNWLSTHPPMPARMARYGKKMFQDEVEALAYKLKQIKHDQEQALIKEQQRQQAAKTMMAQGGTLLSLADDGADRAGSEGISQQRFLAEKFIPLLALREYQNNLRQQPVSSPEAAAHAVLAQFIGLSNASLDKFAQAFKWSDEDKDAIQAKINELNEQHPSTHIQTFLHQLSRLRQYPDKQTLIKHIQTIIKADKSFDLCEMSYLLCLRSALQKKADDAERQDDFKQYSDEIALLLAVVASISSDETNVQASNYDLMKGEAMPTLSLSYTQPTLDDATVKEFYKAIQNVANVKSIYRKALLGTIEKNMLFDGKLSTEQNHLLFALKRAFS